MGCAGDRTNLLSDLEMIARKVNASDALDIRMAIRLLREARKTAVLASVVRKRWSLEAARDGERSGLPRVEGKIAEAFSARAGKRAR